MVICSEIFFFSFTKYFFFLLSFVYCVLNLAFYLSRQAKQDKTTIKVGRIDGNAVESLDAEEVDYTPVEDPFKFRKQKPKTVKFD